MNEENTQRIIEACPEIYERGHAYFGCGDGWADLLVRLSRSIAWKMKRWSEVVAIKQGFLDRGEEPLPWIDEYFEKHPSDPWAHFRVDQVKEKFGTLRFYVGSYPDIPAGHAVMGMISFAEMMSGSICEECGRPGERRGGGWIQTLCDTCNGPPPESSDLAGLAERES